MTLGTTGPHIRGTVFLLSLACYQAHAQQPVVASKGVVNAASLSQPVAPGSIVSIFGSNLADAVYDALSTPLPHKLGGTSVTIGGVSTPLFYVSPGQINAQVPSSLSDSYTAYAPVNVVVTTKAGVSAPAAVLLYVNGPGVFTANGSGCGQAAALNVAPDGSLSLNSTSNSAAPGDSVVLFGTGFGQPYFRSADGTPALGVQTLGYAGGFSVNGAGSYSLQYLGVAPGLVGTDQANLQIPMGTRNGCAVPVEIGADFAPSQTVSISINAARGQCVDPAPQSYGTIALVRTISTGTSADGETDTLSARFPSGPQLTRPAVSQTTAPGDYIANSGGPSLPSRSCPVAGYAPLSAGTINVNGPTGSAALAPDLTTGSVAYSKSLPTGFLFGGTYNFSFTGGSTIGNFQGSVAVDPPIQVTAVDALASNSPNPVTIAWAGAAPNSMVKVSLVYSSFMSSRSSYGYAPASAGSFTFQPVCSGNPVPMGSGVVCSFGLPGITEVVVEQMPLAARTPTFQVSGLSGDVQIWWTYRYIIGVPAS
jgi:uncharacterized protein (TIGR03437 family)